MPWLLAVAMAGSCLGWLERGHGWQGFATRHVHLTIN